ncbi:MAG TPA: hypothetical protein VNF27_06280 [Candidatus Binataceae bacterium]|nr:hypothetical protein [Candidatus Binataceae bacterium]
MRAPIAEFSATCDAENLKSSTMIRVGRALAAVVAGAGFDWGVIVAPAHPASITANAR